MKAILYIGHGTRSKSGAQEARDFVQRVMTRMDEKIQELCFLELTEPSIEEGFRRCVDRGASEIVVVPLFLLAAGHIKEDIPEALTGIKRDFPTITVTIRNPFGVQGRILDSIAELVRENTPDLSIEDSVLIVGRGSSDPDIHRSFAEITVGIQHRLGVQTVSVCYLAAAEPTFDQGLELTLEKSSGKVIIVPYLLFSGLLLSEINQKVKRLQKQGLSISHTGQLSQHKVIEDLLIERANHDE